MEKQDLKNLMKAATRQDRAAFKLLYEATSAKLFSVAIRITKRRELAEEVLQDAYLKIWGEAPYHSADNRSPISWMVAIVRNRAIDVLRKRTEELPGTDDQILDEADLALDPSELAVQSDDLQRLLSVMDGLKLDHRRCILMAYYYGFTHEEIAQITSLPLGTVKSRIVRALAYIRERMTDD